MLIDFGNPDRFDTDTLPYYFDQAATNEGGSPAPVPGVRADGYLGRPALTGIGGHAFVRWHPQRSQKQIHPAFKTQAYMGGRFLFESFPSGPEFFYAFVTATGEIQVMAAINPDGTVSIYRGFYAEELKQSTVVLNTDQFYKLGFTATIGANGTAAIWNDGTVICRIALGNTEGSGEGLGFSGVDFGLPENCALSHYYYGDGYGHQPTILPRLLVRNLGVSAPGSTFNDWTPSLGTIPDVLNVAPPDFVQRLVAPFDRARFAVEMETLTAAPSIYAVKSTALVRNVDAQDAAVRPGLERDGIGDEAFGFGDTESPLPISTDWQRATRMDWGDLHDFAGWTQADVNETRFGEECIVDA